MTDAREKADIVDSIWIQFGEWPVDNIRKWSREPFDGAAEFRRVLTMADFPSTGNEEPDWIEHQQNACEFCGGSGHKDDAKEAATEIASLRRELERFRSERSYVVGCNDGWDEAIEQAAQVVESFQVPKSPHEGDLKPRRHPSQTSVLIAAAIRKLAEPDVSIVTRKAHNEHLQSDSRTPKDQAQIRRSGHRWWSS